VRTLAERYETPMPDLAKRVTKLEAMVEQHLKQMGIAW
jgi:type I restriction enzyme M protein